MIGHLANNQIFISKLTEIILANLGNENFGVNELAHEMGTSHHILRRRLQAITNKTINQLIREIRLRKALEMLQNENITAAEVAYKVGFSSPAYFNTCFHEFFGYPPGQVTKTIPGTREEISYFQVTIEKDRKGSVKKTLILASSAIVLITVAIFLFYNLLAQPERSVAVLPFKNLSDSTAHQYFIDGITEEINTNLSKIHDMRLISRTSVEQFRESDRSAIEIARKLNVNYIVEGSVQAYGNIFRIWVQVIRATGGESHLLAKSYEQEIRETTDYFSLETRIAQDIASELKAKITGQEESLMQQIPTYDSLAYDYYLKGRKYLYDFSWDSATVILSKAIKQDPGFALARLARASLYSGIYFMKGAVYSGDWKNFDDSAKTDLEIALKISPNSPEVKLEQAEQLFLLDRNYDEALAFLDEIKYQMPNNPYFFALRGYILRRKGKWEESIKEFQKAIILDPLNEEYYNGIVFSYLLMRRYPESLEFASKPNLLGLSWDNPFMRFLTIIYWKGDPEEALRISGLTIPLLERRGTVDLLPNYFYYLRALPNNYFYYKRQFEKIIPNADKFEDQSCYIPKTLSLAHLYYFTSNILLCRTYADSAIAELNLKVKESPEDERYYSALGYAYAIRGEKSEAIENAQKAVKLMPLKFDAWDGADKELDLIKIYVLTGEYDLAMDKIEYMLTLPANLSIPLLKIDPAYDKLRALPRFQKILKTEYKTKY